MNIRICISFFAIMVICLITGYIGHPLMIFFAITVHECAHIITARVFGCKAGSLHITALGEIAVIHGIEMLRFWKRFIVYVSGPVCNIVMACVALKINGFLQNGETAGIIQLFSLYNIALFGFNLLPAYPLDGNILLRMVLGNTMGILPAYRVLVRISRITGIMLIVLGAVQTVLYPYNVSLLCLGVFILKYAAYKAPQIAYDCFNAVLQKQDRIEAQGPMPMNVAYVHGNTPLRKLVDLFRWDYMLAVFVANEGSDTPTRKSPPELLFLTENEIIGYIVINGLDGTVDQAFGNGIKFQKNADND